MVPSTAVSAALEATFSAAAPKAPAGGSAVLGELEGSTTSAGCSHRLCALLCRVCARIAKKLAAKKAAPCSETTRSITVVKQKEPTPQEDSAAAAAAADDRDTEPREVVVQTHFDITNVNGKLNPDADVVTVYRTYPLIAGRPEHHFNFRDAHRSGELFGVSISIDAAKDALHRAHPKLAANAEAMTIGFVAAPLDQPIYTVLVTPQASGFTTNRLFTFSNDILAGPIASHDGPSLSPCIVVTAPSLQYRRHAKRASDQGIEPMVKVDTSTLLIKPSAVLGASSATLHVTTGPAIGIKNRAIEIEPLTGTLHAAPGDVVVAVMGQLKGRDVLRGAADKVFRNAYDAKYPDGSWPAEGVPPATNGEVRGNWLAGLSGFFKFS